MIVPLYSAWPGKKATHGHADGQALALKVTRELAVWFHTTSGEQLGFQAWRFCSAAAAG
jgi:hypothetical protein